MDTKDDLKGSDTRLSDIIGNIDFSNSNQKLKIDTYDKDGILKSSVIHSK